MDDVIITEELTRRPSRLPDYAAENRAMAALAELLASNPAGVLQEVAELVVRLCRADSAGITVREQEKGEEFFRWLAAAGAFADNLNGTMPCTAGPCGTVLTENRILLFSDAESSFPALRGAEPRIYENLLTPWEVNGQLMGMVWAIKHDPGGRFDTEDARLLANFSRFAEAGYTISKHARIAAESEHRLREAAITESERAEALRASEERYRTLVQNVRDYAIFMTNADGVITHWTEGAERVLGYTAAEVTGKHLSILCTADQLEAGADRQELAEAAELGRAEREIWRVRKDGERIWTDEVATAIRDEAGQLVGFTRISRDRTEHKQLQDALQESEERYRLAVENMRDFGVITYDIENRITTWNAGAERILGYLEHEVLGQNGSIIFTEQDRVAGEVEKELVGARRRNQAPDERWHVRKNGSRFWASGVMHAIHDETGRLRGYVKVLRDETERRQWEEEIRSAKEDLEARVAERTGELRRAGDKLQAEVTERLKLLDELVRAQEQERGRIARELHDHLGQHLTALLLGLSAAEDQAAADSSLRNRLATLKELANRLTGDLRSLALELRPPVLDEFGLRAAVLDHLEDWSEQTQIPFDVQWSLPETERLSPASETTIYRILQEALTNIVRHARAARVGVIVRRLDAFVQLIIEDDGRGFDVEKVLSSGSGRHLGLVGMRERAALLGGSLTIESEPGQGTSIFCRLPFTSAGDSGSGKPWER